jgi:membrane-bound lytic murein transglycosylase A
LKEAAAVITAATGIDMRILGAAGLILMLASCSGAIVPPSPERAPPARGEPLPPARQPTPATPIAPIPGVGGAGGTNAALTGLVAGPSLATLPVDRDQAARALAAFKTSCPSLVRRTDASGLTRGTDWQPACDAAAAADPGDATSFFATWLEVAQVGDGRAYATGYFIPEVRTSRERRAGYDVPIYGRPSDLIDVDLGQFSSVFAGKKIRGRVSGTELVPYYDRGEIEKGAIDGSAPVLAWGADPAEIFFLQVQGSGELRMRDGSIVRVGYDDQNGRDYTGIGKLMLDRGLIGRGEASMQGIVAWLRAHPDQGRAIMQENKSFVFFRLLDGPPVGALGLPVVGNVSLAVDPKFVPMGAPVLLSMDRADANGIWIAQDTGGAIKGANRFDTFWGAGDDAAAIAGGMAAHGTAFVLLPKGTIARLNSGG